MNRSRETLDFPPAPTIEEDSGLPKLLKKNRLNRDEYKILRDALGRAPTLAELGVTGAMWSEHCSYKSSKVHLKRLPTKGPQVVVGPGENALGHRHHAFCP